MRENAPARREDSSRIGSVFVKRVVRHKGLFIAAAVVSVVQAGVSLAQPQVVSTLLEGFQENREVYGWIGLLVGLLLAGAVLMGIQQLCISVMAENVVRDTRSSLARQLLGMSFSGLSRFRRGDLLSRATSDTQLLRQALIQSSVQLISGAIIGVGALIAMAFVDLGLLALTVVAILCSLLLVLLAARRLKSLAVASQEGAAAYASAIERALSALPTIRSYNAVGAQMSAVQDAVEQTWDNGVRFARLSAWLTPVTSVAVQASLLLVLGVGGFRVAEGSLSIAALIAFVMYLVMLVGPVGQTASAISALHQAAAADARISEIESVTDSVALASSHEADKQPLPQDTTISFSGVTFAYPDASRGSRESDRPTVAEVTFRVAPGEKVGIVGPSGAGKSTLLSLLERFYDVDAGSIELGGIDIQNLDVDELRGMFSYVQQDAPVLAGSIFENLRLGARDASDVECREALERVNLAYLLGLGADGNETCLGDQGANLSGGERQRLAIGRALLANRPVLLLDEATSQIDSQNESLMQKALSEMAPGTTQLIVAHRLSTIVDSDQIIVMRDGVIEDIGTHAELLERNEFYLMTARQQMLIAGEWEQDVDLEVQPS